MGPPPHFLLEECSHRLGNQSTKENVRPTAHLQSQSELGDTNGKLSPPIKHRSSASETTSSSLSSECYTCTRVFYHQLPLTLETVDGEFCTSALTNSILSSPRYQRSDSQNSLPEYGYISPLKRFLLERYDEQSCILAFGRDIGELNISPPVIYYKSGNEE